MIDDRHSYRLSVSVSVLSRWSETEQGEMEMDPTPLEKAAILVEALPYIRKFAGQTVVVKYGGRAMLSEELKQGVIADCILLKLVGIHPVLVHGGGAAIEQMLKRLGKDRKFVRGHAGHRRGDHGGRGDGAGRPGQQGDRRA